MFPGPNQNPGNARGTDRNRRVSSPLSPIFPLFLEPSGKLSQKVQHLLSEEEPAEGSHPAVIKHRRPGPRNPADGIPFSEWPAVLRRVLEKKEPLCQVTDESHGLHETIRRVILAAIRERSRIFAHGLGFLQFVTEKKSLDKAAYSIILWRNQVVRLESGE